MKAEILTVTPTMAAKWLAVGNEGNRTLRRHRVDFYARALLLKRWRLTHQGIALSKKKRLLDGQHRLTAIVETGLSMQLLVCTEVPDDTFSVLDNGMSRNVSERLQCDKADAAIATAMYRICVHAGMPQEFEVQTILDALSTPLRLLNSVATGSIQRFRRARFVSATALRLAVALDNHDEDEATRIQWSTEQLRIGKPDKLPDLLQSFFLQVINGRAGSAGHSDNRTDEFVRAWLAFSPDRDAQKSRLVIRDTSTAIADAREAFSNVTKGVFAP